MPSEGCDSQKHWPANRAFIAALVNAFREGRLNEAAPAAPRKGPSEEEIASLIRRLVFVDASSPEAIDRASREAARAVIALLTPADRGETRAARDVLAERRRQISGEQWSPEHDDFHEEGELADAAACYAAGSIPMAQVAPDSDRYVSLCPWDQSWWKPSGGRRRNLVKAGALILAEIERLDRAERDGGRADQGGEAR